MTTLRALLAAVLTILLLVLALASTTAFAFVTWSFAGVIHTFDQNQALELFILVAGALTTVAALITILRFIAALLTPRLMLPRCVPVDRLHELEAVGVSRELAQSLRQIIVREDGEPMFDLVGVTSEPIIGSVFSWRARVLVLNPFVERLFSREELEAVVLHECGHSCSKPPVAYLVARQVNAARQLVKNEMMMMSDTSLFYRMVNTVTWLIPPAVGRNFFRSVLKVAALPLAAITTGMCQLIVRVFQPEFHDAEFAADAYVASCGRTEQLAHALVTLAVLKHIVNDYTTPETVHERADCKVIAPLPNANWSILVRTFVDTEYEELAGCGVVDETTVDGAFYNTMHGASITHPSPSSRISRLGDNAAAIANALDPAGLTTAVSATITKWQTPQRNVPTSMALGIVDTCASDAISAAANTLRELVEQAET